MYSQGEVSAQVLAVALMMSVAMGAVDGVCPLEGLDVSETVSRLASKQGIEIDPSEFEVGYCTELNHMMNRRLDLVPESEVYLVRSNNSIVPMRMILEAKKDGRRKARLVLQGFREPPEWDTKSNASPVAFPSTVRSLLFKSGSSEDVISSIDVSVAFLQTEEYGPEEAPRYVSYKPYAGSREYVFRLRGPVYGQRSAPRAWYDTIRGWLQDEMGYVRGENEPCLFVHPVTGHTVVLFVDDFLCRGSRIDSEKFYESLTHCLLCTCLLPPES